VAGIGVAAAAFWAIAKLTPAPKLQPMRFAIVPSAAQPLIVSGFDRNLDVSPDGTHVVYVTTQGQLMVRAIDQLEAEPLRGIEGARTPLFSPDGKWIGFFQGTTELKKVSVSGGPAITLCRTGNAPRGASWGSDDTIVFATSDSSTGLLSVPAGGGDPTVLSKPDAAHGERDHVFPSWLPGGRAVLFTIAATGPIEDAQIAVLDLKTGQRRTLIRGGSHAVYVDPSTGSGQAGYLVYGVGGTLRAIRFDPARLEVLGDAVPVVEQVVMVGTGAAEFSVSRTGALVYVPGSAAGGGGAMRSLVLVGRNGREEAIKAPPRAYQFPRLSPDGTRLAVSINDKENDVWIWDFSHETLTPLTFDPALDHFPTWTPDGRRIVFVSTRAGVSNVFAQQADGTGTVERLTTSANSQLAPSMSPDGTQIVVTEQAPKTGNDLTLIHVGKPQSEPLVSTTFSEFLSEISPDGHWLAYVSNESGRNEIFVRPFPNVNGGRWQVSTAGGNRPAWARSGKELFYGAGDGSIMVVPVQAGSSFSYGNAVKLFEWRTLAAPGAGRTYDVSRDGQRFLMVKEAGGENASAAASSNIVVVLNWTEELKARVPSK
jgi:serine/threonine-protein kinase